MGANASSPRLNDHHRPRNRDRGDDSSNSSSGKSGDDSSKYIVYNSKTSNLNNVENAAPVVEKKRGKHRGRRHQAMANAAAGMLSSFRKTLLHQLLFRKLNSSSLARVANGGSRTSFRSRKVQSPARRVDISDHHQQQQQQQTAIPRTSSRPTSLSRSITKSVGAPVAHFDDADDESTTHSRYSRRFDKHQQQPSVAHQNRSSHAGGAVAQSINQQRQSVGASSSSAATTTHVRIRISCSDSLSDALRRCDASTQTEPLGGDVKGSAHKQRQSVSSCTSSVTRLGHPSSSHHHGHHNNKENRPLSHGEDSSTGHLTKSVSSGISSDRGPIWSGGEATSSSSSTASSSGVDVSSVDESRHSSATSSTSSATNSASSVSKQQQQASNSESKAVVTRRTTIQASTGELLECLGQFVKNRFSHIAGVTSSTVVTWMRAIDRSLISQGWQDTPFISPGTVVFVYMLLRDSSMPHPSARLNPSPSTTAHLQPVHFNAADVMNFDTSLKPTLFDLHCHVNACLYIAYSYAGIEISYPQRPFNVVEQPPPSTPPTSTIDFWQRTIDVTLALSDKMLRLNSDPLFFARTFAELKSQGVVTVATNTTSVGSTTPAITTHRSHHQPTQLHTSNTSNSPPTAFLQAPSDATPAVIAEPLNNASCRHHGRTSINKESSNNGIKSATLVQTGGGLVRNSATVFANHNSNTCRGSVVTPGLMMARERAGEHYTSLFI